MSPSDAAAAIPLQPTVVTAQFDREPFAFTHNLPSGDIFAIDALERLAASYVARDYFIASGAPRASTHFYDVKHGDCGPIEAFGRLVANKQRILLKRPELYDRRFKDLLNDLYGETRRAYGTPEGKLKRLAGSILITSCATITPFHFDPEITMFYQISGKKIYHVYSPSVLGEAELENFYAKGVLNIAQVPLEGRDQAHEVVYDLNSGRGFHQPRNAPHWVETSDTISISYAFSFETDRTRATGRTRAFNCYARAARLPISRVGAVPSMDRLKAVVMSVAIPLRRGIARTARGALRLRR